MISDLRATRARLAHRLSREKESEATRYRSERDELIRALRREDPEHWTYTALAKAVGCSPELVAYTVKNG